jgi:hypothetical protein
MLFYKSAKQSVRHFGVFMVKKRYEGPEKGRKLAMSGIPVSPPKKETHRKVVFLFWAVRAFFILLHWMLVFVFPKVY